MENSIGKNQKIILATYCSGGNGKSGTIKAFSDLLLKSYSHKLLATYNRGSDIGLIVEIKGVKIGIESMGDPNSGLKSKLDNLVKMGCDIIICTSRTGGQTVWDVQSIEALGYDLIWNTPYQIKNNRPVSHNVINDLKAKHMLDLLQNFKLI